MQLPLQGLCTCPLLLGNVIYVDLGGCCISVISFERIGLISLRSDPPFLYLCRGLKLCGLRKQTWEFVSRKSEDAVSLTTASYNLPFVGSTMYTCMCANAQRVHIYMCMHMHILSALVSEDFNCSTRQAELSWELPEEILGSQKTLSSPSAAHMEGVLISKSCGFLSYVNKSQSMS